MPDFLSPHSPLLPAAYSAPSVRYRTHAKFSKILGTFLANCVNYYRGSSSAYILLSWGLSVKNSSSWKLHARTLCVFALILFAAGCGGGYSGTQTPPATPSVTLSSSSLTFPAISQGASSSPMTITVTNNGTGALTISSIVAGGTNPGDFTNTNTCTAAVTYLNTCTITVTFVPTASGMRSETLTITDNASTSPQVINVSGTANAIAVAVSPLKSAIGLAQTQPFTATGDPAGFTWSVAGFTDSSMVTGFPAGTIDASGNYTPPSSSPSFFAVVTATSKTDSTKSASATVNVVGPGSFSATLNPQVAQYAVILPSSANVSVQFGLDTNYGLTTWTIPTSSTGALSGPLYVAGMKASTPYHMRGVIAFADGSSFNDSDFTFTTGTPPANLVPTITTTITPGMTPQSGVELLAMVTIASPTKLPESVVTDLSGNTLWAYQPTLPGGPGPNPIKLLPNGHFLIVFSGQPDGANTVIQEVDLGGNLIWQMTTADLNSALAAATCAECNITVLGAHHDLLLLPNGHLILLVALQKTQTDGTTPTGDAVIDLDQNHNVVWAWNEFNHLDTNRRPYLYPDWTHTNAVIYSPDDGNLIVSSRHQNWLIKFDYNNGMGTGNVLWKLGYQGDFALLNADGSSDTTNTDWFFAQHGPAFVSPNTTGQFSLVLFDNGDDRGVVDVVGGTCGVAGQPACFSTVPILDIDETAKTATLAFHQTTPDYSFFGGNAETLKNGNVEFNECGATTPANSSNVFEVTQAPSPQTVWHMNISAQYAYRAMRIPSLYPGVQW
jgi:arylsulfate sulfotransferase